MIGLDILLEQYFEYLTGNKITIISEIQETGNLTEKNYTFRYCLFYDFTETGDAEINKNQFKKWKIESKQKSLPIQKGRKQERKSLPIN